MPVWSGVVAASAVLLVITGVPKARRPAATITALRSVGAVWVGPRAVRALAVAEIVTGSAALVIGGRLADAAVGMLYLGFAAFLVRALRTPTASCGCTSRDDTPPSVGHLVMTAVFSCGGFAAAVAGGRTGIVTVAAGAPVGQSVAAMGFALLATWLAWSILTLSRGVPTPRRT